MRDSHGRLLKLLSSGGTIIPRKDQKKLEDSLVDILNSGFEEVHHPAHYNSGMIEHVEYAEDQGWAPGYHLGNATKYIQRAGKKPSANSLSDLRKARWYLDRLIQWMEKGPDIWKIQKKNIAATETRKVKVVPTPRRRGRKRSR